MKDLGYRPNGAARALVRGQQPIVGVITRDTFAFGRSRMLAAIEERARRAGYVVAVAIVDPADLETNPGSLDVLLSQPIVGVIVLEHNVYNATLLGVSLGAVPVAAVTDGVTRDVGVPHVLIDDRVASLATTRYLLSLGHRTVHHVAVPASQGPLHSRELGWLDALEEAGASIPEPIRTDWSLEAGRQAGRDLAADPDVTAVFCSNDELAFAVMRSLHESGRRVPDDVSVAGLDDHPLARLWVPSLTCYRLDWGWAGAAAFELLADPVDGRRHVGESSSGLIVRESTSKPHAP